MTEYKDNVSYERDKARLINILIANGIGDFTVNLLKQSMWIGNDESIRPIPVVRDGNGKLIRNYYFKDWFQKLNEELDEVKAAVAVRENKFDGVEKVAEELQDLITVCTSMQQWLGFDEVARDDLTNQINEKNRRRGYL